MMSDIRYGLFMVAELLLRLCVNPRVRAKCLALLGATLGKNVRIYECRFINVRCGFRNLVIGDDVHIGGDCMIDLEGPVRIGAGTVLAPRVVIMTHADAGSSHQSPLSRSYPAESNGVSIGEDCWIGVGATVLSGSTIGSTTIVGACSLVRGTLDSNAAYVGIPARRLDGG